MKSNKLIFGILAHVDAGKTTLAESILYQTGTLRSLGRVDHGNAYLDTDAQERARGITIFSKQAELTLHEKAVTLLDTPGHVDFSAEMERTLQILDYGILVISGADGVQGHVQTLWRLLKHYGIPVFLFVNKMDQDGVEKALLLQELQSTLDSRIVDFTECQGSEAYYESLAVCEEAMLEHYLEAGEIPLELVQERIQQRQVFPCFFGSALKMQGIEAFLEGLNRYTLERDYPDAFGAKVYKITRDKQGQRLTHLKITGGSLKVKDVLKEEEKVDQIRIYSGNHYTTVAQVSAGTVCTVTGIDSSICGEGIGIASTSSPLLVPVLTYQIVLPEQVDVHKMYLQLKQLEEEEPELHIVWNESTNELHAQVMGEVQIEILKTLIWERFQIAVDFGKGSIVYKETISDTVEGCGHYEPLRHYAEVRLLLEPAEAGSGMTFETNVSEDILDRNWQRLVLTHLQERAHRGVLTGSEITDMKITLIQGKAHLKHTEGGDFRQATYRAVRHGLKSAQSVLLEPVYDYRLEVPQEMVGRAMADLQCMHASFSAPELDGAIAVLTGTAPVVHMRDYQREVVAYTKGHGRLFLSFQGYEPCHNQEEVIAAIGYDSESDLEHPTGSVFCSHGSGFVVPWQEVEGHMHTDSPRKITQTVSDPEPYRMPPVIDEEELKEIFERTYGTIKREKPGYLSARKVESHANTSTAGRKRRTVSETEYLLVDGYNIIFAWKDLQELAQINIEGARTRLLDILCNYQGYRKQTVIVVFDAYKVAGNVGEMQTYHNIHVVYTKEAETADQYIEKAVRKIAAEHQVTVATSDAMEQMIIMGQGANRLSAKGLLEEITFANQELREGHLNQNVSASRYLFDELDEHLAEWVDDVRLGRKTIGTDTKKE